MRTAQIWAVAVIALRLLNTAAAEELVLPSREGKTPHFTASGLFPDDPRTAWELPRSSTRAPRRVRLLVLDRVAIYREPIAIHRPNLTPVR